MPTLENQTNTIENNEELKIAVESQQEDLSQEVLKEWLEEQDTSFRQETVVELEKTNEYAKLDDPVLEKIKQDTNIEAELSLVDTGLVRPWF